MEEKSFLTPQMPHRHRRADALDQAPEAQQPRQR
jgi:hypothetical protein